MKSGDSLTNAHAVDLYHKQFAAVMLHGAWARCAFKSSVDLAPFDMPDMLTCVKMAAGTA
ncbi:MAG: hypothetical protein DMG40_03235 [Acidobacteria bacterium]|nr:MAG: hypothetical protein DMG40_03235 [Acidobacteriota bacterium]